MTEKEIYQLIEEHKEESDALYERIHEQVESSIVAHAQAKKRRKKIFSSVFSVATALVLIVCLAVVLPIVLQGEVEDVVQRYSDGELRSELLECNLKEYYQETNQSLLFIDRYENADAPITRRYYKEGNESETVYLYESFMDEETGYNIKLSIMKRNVSVDTFDEKLDECEIFKTFDPEISYRLDRKRSVAKFEYEGYKYYLEIDDKVELSFFIELIASMIPN